VLTRIDLSPDDAAEVLTRIDLSPNDAAEVPSLCEGADLLSCFLTLSHADAFEWGTNSTRDTWTRADPACSDSTTGCDSAPTRKVQAQDQAHTTASSTSMVTSLESEADIWSVSCSSTETIDPAAEDSASLDHGETSTGETIDLAAEDSASLDHGDTAIGAGITVEIEVRQCAKRSRLFPRLWGRLGRCLGF